MRKVEQETKTGYKERKKGELLIGQGKQINRKNLSPVFGHLLFARVAKTCSPNLIGSIRRQTGQKKGKSVRISADKFRWFWSELKVTLSGY